MAKLRQALILVTLALSGLTLAMDDASGDEPATASTSTLSLDLATLVRERQPAGSPVIDPATLDALTLERGRVRIDSGDGLELTFLKPLLRFSTVIDDPGSDSAFELRWFRGPFPLGTQRFAPRALGLPDTLALEGQGLTVTSAVAFDRVELLEIHGDASAADPEYVTTVTVTTAPARTPSEVAAKNGVGAASAADTNTAAALCQLPLGLAYNVAFGAGLVAVDPVSSAIADSAAYTANLGLKFCKTVLIAPGDLDRQVPAGTCSTFYGQDHMVSGYENALGIALPFTFEYNWGGLGTPFVYHHNTEVEVGLYYGNPTPPESGTLDLPFLVDNRTATIDATDRIYQDCDDKRGTVATSTLNGVEYACPFNLGRTLEFPVGRNTVLWRANAKVSPTDLFPVSIPGYAFGVRTEPWKTLIEKIVARALVIGADTYLLNGWRWGNTANAFQKITVWDEVPPTIDPDPEDQPRITTTLVNGDLHVQIEADEPGGVSQRNYERLLGRMYNVFDACDRDVTFFASYPSDALRTFWPVSTESEDNTFTMTWTARDPGPNLDNERNVTTAAMTVEVVDIRPPAIVPPPDIVEITTGQVTALGQPLVFDFVDLDPTISNDADLPLGQGLHVVTWTATDASGNSAQATQLVNIKSSNLDPVALAQTGANANTVVSFEPTVLRLEGNDPDDDPLRFTIEDYPDDGFFVAPLYPYFVEDFRLAATVSDADLTERCNGPTGPGTAPDYELEFPLEPSYFDVNDDGTTFVLDRGSIRCNSLDTDDYFSRRQRIARFDAVGNLVNVVVLGNDNYRDLVVDDQRQRLYLTQTNSRSKSSVTVYDENLAKVENFPLDKLKNRATEECGLPDNGPCEILNARSAVLDSNGLLYVMDNKGLIYAVEKFPGNQVKFVDLVSDDVGIQDAGTAVPADQLALDPAGNLYASRNNRIYRYAASTIGEDGQPYPGTPTGWLGRCDTDLAPGDAAVCDVRNRRSLGFSCTDAVCGIEDAITQEEKDFCGLTSSNLGNFGCRPGQFRSPRGIDLDARGNLYVADSANERVQRFTPEGFFAGEAESACDGSCFVLGDFGNPEDISVNSRQFFILDPQSDLLHVSLLTPFTDIGPDWAELVYQSDNEFACANPNNCIDRFEFSVSDGVRDAETGRPVRTAPAAVEVKVGRNFRPPVATPGIVAAVNEDTPTDITLDGAELDPLDTLSFVLVEPPENGTVTIIGNEARYQGNRDYVGADSFQFAASDGTSQSDPEPVAVTVLNLNDAPRVSPLADETTGAGFTFRLAHDFSDPDTGEAHLLAISWGDGTIETEGSRDSQGNADGPILDTIGNGLGRITASHVYETTGPKTLEICITDQVIGQGPGKLPTPASLTDCQSATINVTEARDLALSVTPSTDIALPGQFVSYDFEVSNLAPSAGPGSPATGIEFTLDLADEFEAGSITVNGAGCSRQGFAVRCDVGQLAAGASSLIRVSAQVPGDVGIGVSLRSFANATMAQADQTPNNDLLTITPVVRPGDHLVGSTGDALRDQPDSNPGDGFCASVDGACTLRAAFEEALASPGIQVIVLGNGVYRLEDSSLPSITKDIVVLGNGPQNTLIDGTDLGRVFGVDTAGSLRVEDVTIANTVGPAISTNGQTIVRRTRFTNNYARSFFGGAILNAGHLELRDVTFDGNRSDNDGGAVWNASNSSSEMVNVTAYGNEQSAFAFTGGTHTLTNVTITGNTGGTGWEAPAGALNAYGANTVVTLINTALVGNLVGPVGGTPNCIALSGARIISGGNNVFGDLDGCPIDLQATDRVVDGEPLELAPDRRSGLTTLRPEAGSLLIDRGQVNACPDTDARGVPRPQDGNDDGNARCDIGAVERRANLVLRSTFE